MRFPSLISPSPSAASTASTAAEVFFLHRPCFVDGEITSADFLSIELSDCFLGSGVVSHLHESEPLRAAGIAICNDLNRFNLTDLGKHVTQVCLRDLKR